MNVLVADDEPELRVLLCDILTGLGDNVVAVENGAAAVAAVTVAAANGSSFDLLVTDIGMPEIDGIELVKALRQNPNPRVNGIKIVVVSGGVDAVRSAEAVDAGANAFIQKPFSIEALSAAVEAALRTP